MEWRVQSAVPVVAARLGGDIRDETLDTRHFAHASDWRASPCVTSRHSHYYPHQRSVRAHAHAGKFPLLRFGRHAFAESPTSDLHVEAVCFLDYSGLHLLGLGGSSLLRQHQGKQSISRPRNDACARFSVALSTTGHEAACLAHTCNARATFAYTNCANQ